MADKETYVRQLRDSWQEDSGREYIFISYASQDWERVYPCVLALRELGVRAFIDTNFQRDKGWLKNIEDRLFNDSRCRGMVAFVSTGYLGSYACLAELLANRTETQRMKRGKPLPVLYLALEEQLRTVQGIGQHIQCREVHDTLAKIPVACTPAELSRVENYLLSLYEERGEWQELRKRKLLNDLKEISNRFNVAYFMNSLIFSTSSTEDMPSFQVFQEGDSFVQDLAGCLRELIWNEEENRAGDDSARLARPKSEEQLSPPSRGELPPVERLTLQAKSGDARAQHALGQCYFYGVGTGQDAQLGAQWFRQAAELGDVNAQNDLAVCYTNGIGVEQDGEQALHWYQQAAERGSTLAMCNLGRAYERGLGVKKSFLQAAKWLRRAAELGDPDGQIAIGYYLIWGLGVLPNHREAFQWFHKAAEQGAAEGQLNVAWCYANGAGVKPDPAQTVYWYQQAAEQGNAFAQHQMGCFYINGAGVAQDAKQAFLWFRQAAEQGYPDAQNNMGWYYFDGIGEEADGAQAVRWFRPAAEAGLGVAQYGLGLCYQLGFGVEEDEVQAVHWFRQAAKQNHSEAQNQLAYCYGSGTGVEEDQEQAVYWLRRAAENGSVDAQKLLEELEQ